MKQAHTNRDTHTHTHTYTHTQTHRQTDRQTHTHTHTHTHTRTHARTALCKPGSIVPDLHELMAMITLQFGSPDAIAEVGVLLIAC